jgi:ABC-type multidrug transport system fused ATPase/permease subunit
MFLQKALLRKFLNYDEDVRIDLVGANLIMALTRDVTSLVHEGYLKGMELERSLTQMVAILLFQVTAPTVFDKPIKPAGFIFLVIFPPILLTFLEFRKRKTTSFIDQRNDRQDDVVAAVERTVKNYRLIADFNRRPFFEERFVAAVGGFNKAGTAAAMVLKNNGYFAPWITTISICFYTLFFGMKTTPEGLSMFLANLSIIGTIGGASGNIYKLLMDMQAISPALIVITELLNMATDLSARKALNRVNRGKTKEMRAALLEKGGHMGWPIDLLPIMISDVKYNYKIELAGETDAFNCAGTVSFQQGELIAIVGPGGQGKSTLLKLLGGVVLGEPGQVYVPSSLRLLHISTDTLFFKGTLHDNLKLGINRGSPDEKDLSERLLKCCSLLGLPQHLLELAKQEDKGPILVWGDILARSEQCLIGIARALLANPELLCIHKPLMAQQEEVAAKVMNQLRDFVDQKGVLLDPEMRHVRRPRTCIMTAAKAKTAEDADTVFKVTHEGVIQLKRSEVAAEFDGIVQ